MLFVIFTLFTLIDEQRHNATIFQWNVSGFQGRPSDDNLFSNIVFSFKRCPSPVYLQVQVYPAMSSIFFFSSNRTTGLGRVLLAIGNDITFLRHEITSDMTNEFVAATV